MIAYFSFYVWDLFPSENLLLSLVDQICLPLDDCPIFLSLILAVVFSQKVLVVFVESVVHLGTYPFVYPMVELAHTPFGPSSGQLFPDVNFLKISFGGFVFVVLLFFGVVSLVVSVSSHCSLVED